MVVDEGRQDGWLATFYEQSTFRAKIPTFLAGPWPERRHYCSARAGAPRTTASSARGHRREHPGVQRNIDESADDCGMTGTARGT
jgi:hypothetical protein